MYFRPTTLEEGKETVVGTINGFSADQRWELETPLFAKAIRHFMPKGTVKALDYGCGVGRLAKELLKIVPGLSIHGVDTSTHEMELAEEYVGNKERFYVTFPDGIHDKYKLVYCIYVLQHVPAIELRDTIRRIYDHLEDDGVLVYCSSDSRMAVVFDQPGFMDDRALGVDIRKELSEYFEVVEPLFTDYDIEKHPILKAMIPSHPALVYRKKATLTERVQVQGSEDVQQVWSSGLKDLDAGHYDLAKAKFVKAATLAPTSGLPWAGLAMAYGKEFKIWDLLGAVKESLKRENLPDAYNQLIFGLTQMEADDALHDVLEYTRKEFPKENSLKFARGVWYLNKRIWDEGWEGWRYRDSRMTHIKNMTKTFPDVPEWDGKSKVKTLFVLMEHGLGDKILFMRYVDGLRKYADTVKILAGVEAIVTLLRENFPQCVVVGPNEVLTASKEDAWFGIESIMHTPYKLVPHREAQYVFADEKKIESFATAIRGGKLKVGICWKGSPIPEPYRTIPWEEFKPIVDQLFVGNSEVYSLQFKEPCPDSRVDTVQISRCSDLSDTAALVANLDLVISVDTSVAHLAAALGVKTFVLRPRPFEWRWGNGTRRSPFYADHVSVFPQKVRGVWRHPIAELCNQLH